MWKISSASVSSPFTSALLSAFFSRCSKNSHDFFGLRVQPLYLRVALRILQQVQQKLARLFRPPALRGASHLGLGVAADAAVKVAEGDGLLLFQHVLEVLFRLLEGHVADGVGGDAGVLEVDAQVGPRRLARLCAVLRVPRVLDHRSGAAASLGEKPRSARARLRWRRRWERRSCSTCCPRWRAWGSQTRSQSPRTSSCPRTPATTSACRGCARAACAAPTRASAWAWCTKARRAGRGRSRRPTRTCFSCSAGG
mmetsp:Transcript_50390/g.164208  ORF Transcript_50390/g.164208 Transcript_50390/m.164208 type:complete len:254 (+) Transcript_50390:325-1086(+)